MSNRRPEGGRRGQTIVVHLGDLRVLEGKGRDWERKGKKHRRCENKPRSDDWPNREAQRDANGR